MSFTETQLKSPEVQELGPEPRIGHYEVTDHLATTGMSVVYAGVSLQNGEPVAIKLPRDNNNIQPLRDEIALHTQFSDCTGIVTIDGCGVFREKPFLATRLQEGGSLEDELESTATITLPCNWVEKVINDLSDDICQGDTSEVRDIDHYELREVVRVLSKEGVTRLITDNQVSAELVIEAVAGAAVEHGHNLTADSVMAKQAAKMLLEKEIAKDAKRPAEAELPDIENIMRRINILRGASNGVIMLNGAGIVLNDFKPGNTCSNKKGEGVVIDLGIAGPIRTLPKERIKGTLAYLPPEAYKGVITPGVDDFGVAATAYEALGGQTPWPAFDDAQQTYNYMYEYGVTPLRAINPDVPATLSSAIMKGLKWYRRERLNTAGLKRAFELHC